MNEEFIDNALVHQKDALFKRLGEINLDSLEIIQRPNHIQRAIEDIADVLSILRFNSELWVMCKYGYKGLEVVERCLGHLKQLKEDLTARSTTKIQQVNMLILLSHRLESWFREHRMEFDATSKLPPLTHMSSQPLLAAVLDMQPPTV